MGKETIWAIIAAAGTGLFSWIYSHLKTKREQKQSDLELINAAIQPLLNSIRGVTEQNSELIGKYTSEQDKVMKLIEEKAKLLTERGNLIAKVSRLEKLVQELNNKINDLIKSSHEKIEPGTCKYPSNKQ